MLHTKTIQGGRITPPCQQRAQEITLTTYRPHQGMAIYLLLQKEKGRGLRPFLLKWDVTAILKQSRITLDSATFYELWFQMLLVIFIFLTKIINKFFTFLKSRDPNLKTIAIQLQVTILNN